MSAGDALGEDIRRSVRVTLRSSGPSGSVVLGDVSVGASPGATVADLCHATVALGADPLTPWCGAVLRAAVVSLDSRLAALSIRDGDRVEL
ncbi:MAG: hypothetical protein GX868_00350, partial [Actinobacteria bacterium]|nr:hypothetical protein [Actinomycetota bacterium]